MVFFLFVGLFFTSLSWSCFRKRSLMDCQLWSVTRRFSISFQTRLPLASCSRISINFKMAASSSASNPTAHCSDDGSHPSLDRRSHANHIVVQLNSRFCSTQSLMYFMEMYFCPELDVTVFASPGSISKMAPGS